MQFFSNHIYTKRNVYAAFFQRYSSGTARNPEISLPKGRTNYPLLGVLHVIALARIVILNAINWPDDASEKSTLLLRCENDRLRSEIALLQRELEIKDARFSRIEPRKRPACVQNERYEILVIRSARGWNNAQPAKRFQVTVQTIQNGLRRAEAGKETAQMPVKVTRYPDFVRFIVQQFKISCPFARTVQNGRDTRSGRTPSISRHRSANRQ